MLRKILNGQQAMCKWFDRNFFSDWLIDGNRDYIERFVAEYVRPGDIVYDIGGGKNPYFDLKAKRDLGLKIYGLDIDPDELDRAPSGIYDYSICSDITKYIGRQDADLLICQAVLEHVPDTDSAIKAISSILKPGGVALLFIPSRNSSFARFNMILPQGIKRWLLKTIYPASGDNQGFIAYYDRCTPGDMRMLLSAHQLKIVEERFYWTSAYYTFCFPLHVLWRVWLFLYRLFRGNQAAETFSLACRYDPESAVSRTPSG